MTLFLEIKSGPKTGEKHRVKPGLAIGRREGDILLDQDGKVSSLHGRVELNNKGQAVLVDQGSSNAFVLNSRRVKKVALLPGLTFRVGDTLFAVIELSEQEAESWEPRKTWRDHLREELARHPAENDVSIGAPPTFTPPLELEFVQGVQTDEKQVLGYGPRVAGKCHVDIELLELDAPNEAFEIRPGPGAALFRDLSDGKVLVNHAPAVQDQLLNDGDLIGVGGTVIRVRYL